MQRITDQEASALRVAIDLVESTYHSRSCAGIKAAVVKVAPALVCQCHAGERLIIDRSATGAGHIVARSSSALGAWLNAADALVREHDGI